MHERMRLVVLGASGNVGGHFARMAAQRGHQVTAVVRLASHFDAAPGITVVRGNVLEPDVVRSAVQGQDAVMSGLGMRYKHPWAPRESPDDFYSQVTRHIVNSMKQAGVRRISYVSAAGIGDSRVTLNWLMRVMLKVSNVGVAYADLEHAEVMLRESGLDWQAVRPTTLTHGDVTGAVRVTDAFRINSRISRADVAAYMLTELERPEFSARTPMITAA